MLGKLKAESVGVISISNRAALRAANGFNFSFFSAGARRQSARRNRRESRVVLPNGGQSQTNKKGVGVCLFFC
jgi:hypothetical protein